MNRKALLAILLAIFLPLISYLIVRAYTDEKHILPRRYYNDTVITTIKNGKQYTDTLWHSVKNFTLTNQLGKKVSLYDLNDKVIVADFFFTHCISICPTLTKNMKRLQDALKLKNERRMTDSSFVQFISFTVDPERDSASALKKYADRFGVNHDQWWMLTGPKKVIYDIGINELKMGVPDSNTVDTNFIHASHFVLLDKNKVVRGYYNGLDTTALQKLAEDIVFLMLEKEKKKKNEANTDTKK